MANCFGDVIDNFTLDTLSRYVGKPKTQEDRARVASELEDLDDKSGKARRYVHDLKSWYGNGASTLCLVYNQTGDTLYYVTEKNWEGFIGRTPYPTEIGNGQWAAFHHVHMTGTMLGSEAAVMYRGKDMNGEQRDFVLGWRAPTRLLLKNKAYCKIGNVNSLNLGGLLTGIEYSGYSKTDNWDKCSIVAEIGEGYSPVYTARIKVPHSK